MPNFSAKAYSVERSELEERFVLVCFVFRSVIAAGVFIT